MSKKKTNNSFNKPITQKEFHDLTFFKQVNKTNFYSLFKEAKNKFINKLGIKKESL